MPFPEIRAKQLAIAEAYDELAAIGEDIYARYHEPARNLRAVTSVADPAPARLRILKTAVPPLRHVAMPWSADSLGMPWRYKASLATAAEPGITVKLLGVGKIDRSNGAFAAIEREMPDGLVMAADMLGTLNRSQLYFFACKYRLPRYMRAPALLGRVA
jgi:putative tryptophan/tyrosine transport system substrate-binding protein